MNLHIKASGATMKLLSLNMWTKVSPQMKISNLIVGKQNDEMHCKGNYCATFKLILRFHAKCLMFYCYNLFHYINFLHTLIDNRFLMNQHLFLFNLRLNHEGDKTFCRGKKIYISGIFILLYCSGNLLCFYICHLSAWL